MFYTRENCGNVVFSMSDDDYIWCDCCNNFFYPRNKEEIQYDNVKYTDNFSKLRRSDGTWDF